MGILSNKIDREALPTRENNTKRNWLISLGISFGLVLILHFFVVSFGKLQENTHKANIKSLFDISKINISSSFSLLNFFRLVSLKWYLIYLIILGIATLFIFIRINHGGDSQIAYGQKGDSRFTSEKELKAQYKGIDNTADEYPGVDSFDGIGGIPISHLSNKYYIDTDTVNSAILGVSRSGKGETTITPMIDILSRAKIQSSMVVNDPKGELYASSKDTLEARGYDVQVLNIQDPMQSMSYNPLQLVINAWLEGNPEEASKRANSIAYTLYNNPEAGDNAFFNEGAQSAVVGMILALVEHCVDNDMVEKITLNNVISMLNTLGQWNWKEGIQEKNALDEFFSNLPGNHVAKQRFGTTKFAGDKTKGSIFATTSNGLQPFIDQKFAKMTSRNSLNLKQIGFPKYLYGQLNESFLNKRIDIAFVRKEDRSTIKHYRTKVKSQGRFSLNFDEFDGKEVIEGKGIQSGDYLLIKYDTKTLIYQMTFNKKVDKYGNMIMSKSSKQKGQPEYQRVIELTQTKNTFSDGDIQKHVHLEYSNKPTALFMIVPDYDSSNHSIASIFVKQLYTELSENAVETRGNKAFKRVQFILDEFGNMPPIDDMDQVMTVCLGRNILFNLVIQSFSQLDSKYGKRADTIKENCQNLIYILSKNEDTIEEVSKQAGDITAIDISTNDSEAGKLPGMVSKRAEQERLITPTRLRQFEEGHQLIIRSLHRQDLNRNKVRPYPILNSGKTKMPYRFEFLSDWIDTSKELNDIDIASEHSDLDLNDLAIDFSSFFVDEKQRKIYESRYYPERVQEENNEEDISKQIRVATSKSSHQKQGQSIEDIPVRTNKIDEVDRQPIDQKIRSVKTAIQGLKETPPHSIMIGLNNILDNICKGDFEIISDMHLDFFNTNDKQSQIIYKKLVEINKRINEEK